MNLKKVLQILILLVIFGGAGYYAYDRVSRLRTGVDLVINDLENGQSLSENKLTVTGNALLARKLTVNDREVFIDEAGDFEDLVILSNGLNRLEIVALDKFGKESVADFDLFVDKEDILPELNQGPKEAPEPVIEPDQENNELEDQENPDEMI
jgi:hypothetical protein